MEPGGVKIAPWGVMAPGGCCGPLTMSCGRIGAPRGAGIGSDCCPKSDNPSDGVVARGAALAERGVVCCATMVGGLACATAAGRGAMWVVCTVVQGTGASGCGVLPVQ